MKTEGIHTIMRPLIPMMKSNQGSMANSAFWFRNTWKPKAPWVLEVWDGESESRREMKRLRALNMINRGVMVCYGIRIHSIAVRFDGG